MNVAEIGNEKSAEIKSMGEMIDMPMNDFKEYIKPFHVGIISTLILYMENAYNELVDRKNRCVALAVRDNKDTRLRHIVKGIYSEMLKAEGKIVYLKTRKQELLKLDI